MISIEAVTSDLDAINNGTGAYADLKTDSQKLIAIVKVIMKFLSTMRSNQLLTEEEKKKLREEKLAKDKAREAAKK